METHSKNVEIGKYYKTSYGGAQIAIPKALAAKLPFKHSDKLVLRKENKKLYVSALGGGSGG